MNSQRSTLELSQAIEDDLFPAVDLALRRGRHIDRNDAEWYAFLSDAQAALERFYRRFGCELVHKTDGYFYLLPTGDELGRRQLSAAEMLVGQALALLYLDPRMVQGSGVVTRDDVLGHLAQVMTTDGLVRAFNPKKRRLDERVAQETVRSKVSDALRKLSALGFIETLTADNGFRLRSALMRFADPVRGSDSPEVALAELVARGEVVLGTPDELGELEGDTEDRSPDSDPHGLDDARAFDLSSDPLEPRAEFEAGADPADPLAGFDDGADEFEQAAFDQYDSPSRRHE